MSGNLGNVIKEAMGDIALDVAVNAGMDSLREAMKSKVHEFTGKGLPEHRVEMFYNILLGFADEYGTAKRDVLIRRYMARHNREPRSYGNHERYEPLAGYNMVRAYTENKCFLQGTDENFLAWLDEMACRSDAEHDALLDAYEDDKWSRVAERAAEVLEPVETGIRSVVGADSPNLFEVFLPNAAQHPVARRRMIGAISFGSAVAIVIGMFILSY